MFVLTETRSFYHGHCLLYKTCLNGPHPYLCWLVLIISCTIASRMNASSASLAEFDDGKSSLTTFSVQRENSRIIVLRSRELMLAPSLSAMNLSRW